MSSLCSSCLVVEGAHQFDPVNAEGNCLNHPSILFHSLGHHVEELEGHVQESLPEGPATTTRTKGLSANISLTGSRYIIPTLMAISFLVVFAVNAIGLIIVVAGTKGSGKTTVMKQMRILYGPALLNGTPP